MALFFRRNKKATNEGATETLSGVASEEKSKAEQPASLEPDEIKSSTHAELDSGLDLSDFWHDTRESDLRHRCPPLTDDTLREVEKELGHRLPDSYIQLMRMHNGGLVNRCRYRVVIPREGCPDTIYITDIMGIGRDVPYSLCGSFGSKFLIETRGHDPKIGIAICNTTLPGRALVFLDYRACDELGEPCVTWADAQEHIELRLARNFRDFINGLEVNTVTR